MSVSADWVRQAVLNGLDQALGAEVAERAHTGDLTVAELRTLLLLELGGSGLEVARAAALEHMSTRAHLATQVLSMHEQSARSASLSDEERVRYEGDVAVFEARASLTVGDVVNEGGWCAAPTRKGARQQAHLALVSRLTESKAPETRREHDLSAATPTSPTADASAKRSTRPSLTTRRVVVPAQRQPRLRSFQPRQGPATPAPLESIREALAHGAGLTFDMGTMVGTGVFLCLPPQDGSLAGTCVGRTVRPLLLPGGELRDVECLRGDVLGLISLLSGPEDAGWSRSTKIWGAVVRLALELIADSRAYPAVAEAEREPDRHLTWRIGPLADEHHSRLAFLADLLASESRCWRVRGNHEDADHPLDALRSCLDAIADRYVPAPGFALILGEVPLAAPVVTRQPLDQMYDWADLIAEEIAPRPSTGIVLRISEPRHDSPSVLRGRLMLSPLSDSPDSAVDASSMWSREIDYSGSIWDLRHHVTCILRRVGRHVPALRHLGMQPYPQDFLLGPDDILAMRGPASDELRDSGISIHWHKNWAHELDTSIIIGTGSGDLPVDGRLDLARIFDRRWRITLDGTPLSDAELATLASQELPYVWLRNRWVLIDKDACATPGGPLEQLPLRKIIADVLFGQVSLGGAPFACGVAEGLAALFAELRSTEPEPLPSGVALPSLLPHQLSALTWLRKRAQLGLGALLADDMGLGKTRTALALHQCLQAKGIDLPTLVIVPKGLFGTWISEMKAHAVGVKYKIYHGNGRRLPTHDPGTLLLTSYETLSKDADILTARKWGLVVADEAQKIKNPGSHNARAAHQLEASARLAMTGTPLENRAEELWAILDWCNPEMFGSARTFNRRYAEPLLNTAQPDQAADTRARINHMLAPVMLRRLKAQIPSLALPDKIETLHSIPLSTGQIGCMEAVASDTQAQANIAYDGAMPGLLTWLRQLDYRKISSSLDHYRGTDAEAAVRDLAEAEQRAPKLTALRDLLAPVRAAGESALIFTPFTYVVKLVSTYLRRRGHDVLEYHGGLTNRQREAVCADFNGKHPRVLVLTVQAGAIGLNLTAANHVIHYGMHWNPATKHQANDRVHRIGQQRPVHIHYLEAAKSIDEHIRALIERKQDLADAFNGPNEELAALCHAAIELDALQGHRT